MKTCFELIFWILPTWQSILFSGLALMLYVRGDGYHRLMLSLYMAGSFVFFLFRGPRLLFPWPDYLRDTIHAMLWLLQLPLFYLFLKSLLVPDFVLRRREIRHFLGPMLAGVGLLVFRAFVAESAYLSWEWATYIVMLTGFVTQFVVYVIYSRKRFPSHMRLIFNYYSDPEPYELNWLRWLLFSFVGLFFVVDVMKLLYVELFSVSNIGYHIMVLIFNFAIGFFGITQPVLFYEHRKTESLGQTLDVAVAIEPEVMDSVSNGSLNIEIASQDENARLKDLFEKARVVMETEKSYENPDLTLSDLAKTLNVNTKYLSNAINTFSGQSFSTWVNEYRVKAVAALFKSAQGEKLSMDAIYEACGFRNKSTFMNAFKKYYGMTPGEFRKSLR